MLRITESAPAKRKALERPDRPFVSPDPGLPVERQEESTTRSAFNFRPKTSPSCKKPSFS
jgi:hypothetical protein